MTKSGPPGVIVALGRPPCPLPWVPDLCVGLGFELELFRTGVLRLPLLPYYSLLLYPLVFPYTCYTPLRTLCGSMSPFGRL